MRTIRANGEEMLSRAPEGAIIGVPLGAAAGFLTGFVINSMVGFESIRWLGAFGIFLTTTVVGALFFGAAGALIGAGVPKVNPHPQQGARGREKPVKGGSEVFSGPRSMFHEE